MATPNDLMGLGMAHFLAHCVGSPISAAVSSQGSTFASATAIPGGNRKVLVIASNSGSALAMPSVGSDFPAARLGDEIIITNILSASVNLLFNNTVLGSATTIYVDGGSVTGLTGVSVASGKPLLLSPISVSTWIGLRSA